MQEQLQQRCLRYMPTMQYTIAFGTQKIGKHSMLANIHKMYSSTCVPASKRTTLNGHKAKAVTAAIAATAAAAASAAIMQTVESVYLSHTAYATYSACIIHLCRDFIYYLDG